MSVDNPQKNFPSSICQEIVCKSQTKLAYAGYNDQSAVRGVDYTGDQPLSCTVQKLTK